MLVTIGIPVFNAGKYLKIAIQSVLNQTFTDFELIIIDDGSTDDSIKIIESFNDERIIFIKDGLNKALPYRLNQIVKLARGKYLARMDADDVMDKDRIKIQIEILEKNNFIDVLGTNTYIIDKDNILIGIRKKINTIRLFKVNSFIHPTIVGKTEWFLKNPYDEKAIRIEDLELWDRTNLTSNFHELNQPLLYYRELETIVYKKYFLTIRPCFNIFIRELKKTNLNKSLKWLNYFINAFFKTIIYFVLKLINKDKILLKKRFIEITDKVKINEL
jgi:glycosyltransferase involved in cell wall biosynthesis